MSIKSSCYCMERYACTIFQRKLLLKKARDLPMFKKCYQIASGVDVRIGGE